MSEQGRLAHDQQNDDPQNHEMIQESLGGSGQPQSIQQANDAQMQTQGQARQEDPQPEQDGQEIQGDMQEEEQEAEEEAQQSEAEKAESGNNQQKQQEQPVQQSQPGQPSVVENPTVSAVQKPQSYINRLQNILQQKQARIIGLISLQQSQKQQIHTLSALLSQKDTVLHTKIKQIQASQHKSESLQEQIEGMSTQIKALQSELSSYRQIGDIKSLIYKLEELELMVNTQSKQISILQSKQSEQQHNSSDKLLKHHLQKAEQMNKQNEELSLKAQYLQRKLQASERVNEQNNEIMSQMDTKLKQKLDQIANLQQSVADITATLDSTKDKYQEKVKMLEEVQEKLYKETNGLKPESLDEIIKEKQILFREFKRLELEKINLEDFVQDLKAKLNTLRQENKLNAKTRVSKRDYDELMRRYLKCKNCLEKAIAQNTYQQSSGQTEQQVQQQLNEEVVRTIPSSNILSHNVETDEQDNLKLYMSIFNKHVQSSIDLFKGVGHIFENSELQKYRDRIAKAEKQKQQLTTTIEQLNRINQIFEQELVFKNTMLDRMTKENKSLKDQNSQMVCQLREFEYNDIKNRQAKSALDRLEAGSMNLIVRNRKLLAEKENWKSLYRNLKSQYQSFLTRQPGYQVEEMIEERKQSCHAQQLKEGENRVEEPRHVIETRETHAQTEGMSQFYYKQIKLVLRCLKRFPQNVKNMEKILQTQKAAIDEVKNKYDKVLEKYNLKFRTLQNEKNGNDLWRKNCREEIRDTLISEFQDIREFIENDRIVNTLSKAKNLIEDLEKQEQPYQEEIQPKQ